MLRKLKKKEVVQTMRVFTKRVTNMTGFMEAVPNHTLEVTR